MSDLREKDPAIKLFGKTIALPVADESPVISGAGASFHVEVDTDRGESLSPEKSGNRGGFDDELDKDQVTIQSSEDVTDPEATSGVNDNPKTPSIDNESATQTNSKSTEDQGETSGSQDKSPKKPEKIIPCPRCTSMETKFCYYNNYNVNQPRHFCKHCMRYWTAGGTMRNVPVGAGRRKNKSNSASHFSIHSPRVDVLKTNGTVLAFGSDAPLCESMASVLNLADKTVPRNGFHKHEEQRENREDFSNGFPSITAPPNIKDEPVIRSCNGYPPQVPCFPGPPWPYPMPSPQWATPLPPPPFCPPTFPVAFYPPQPYWGYIPCMPMPNPSVPCPSVPGGPKSPTLGKHPRENGSVFKPINVVEDDESLKESTSERNLWVPKTLRIDDPGEAAKSSIWSTLGIKMDKGDSISGGGLFKAFHSKGDEKNQIPEASPVLQANPAALSRSRNFHETS